MKNSINKINNYNPNLARIVDITNKTSVNLVIHADTHH